MSLWRIAKLVLGIGLIGALLLMIPVRDTMARLANAQIFPLVIVAVMQVVGSVVCTFRWKQILASQGIFETWPRLFKLQAIGSFMGNFLPSSVGGDAYRMWCLRHQEDKVLAAVVSVPVERILASVASLLVGVMGCVIRPREAYESGAVWVLAAGFVATALLLGVTHTRLRAYVERWRDKVRFRPLKLALNAWHVFASYSGNKALMFKALGWSIVYQFIMILDTWLYCASIGVTDKLDAMGLVLMVPVIGVISMIPLSINALGIREGANVFFLGFLGVPADGALAVALASRVLRMVTSLLGGVIYLLDRGKRGPRASTS